MAALTKDALLALKPKIEAVPVPELGEGVELCVRELTGFDVLEWGALLADGSGDRPLEKLPIRSQKPLMQFLLERGVCHPDGSVYFDEGEALLAPIPWATLQHLCKQVMKISKMDQEAAETSKKSSEETPTSILPAA